MSDLISRIDAIEAVRLGDTMTKIQQRIRKLPSAQQDKDAIHLQKEQAYMQGWEDGRKALREEMWEDERDRLDRQTGGD